MPPTLFLEAFGRLSPDTAMAVIDSEEEDLYSIFNARAEMMGWSTTAMPRPQYRLLWGMNEAELTPGANGTRIGWVQVGLKAGNANPAAVLPALVQCFDDALRRFGIVELSSLQVMAIDLEPGTGTLVGCVADLISGLNFFNLVPKSRVEALVAFDQELLGSRTTADLAANLQRGPVSFKFGQPVTVPDGDLIKVPAEAPFPAGPLAPSRFGVPTVLPEWSATAAGWVLATVVDAAHGIAPDVENFAVRITRVR